MDLLGWMTKDQKANISANAEWAEKSVERASGKAKITTASHSIDWKNCIKDLRKGFIREGWFIGHFEDTNRQATRSTATSGSTTRRFVHIKNSDVFEGPFKCLEERVSFAKQIIFDIFLRDAGRRIRQPNKTVAATLTYHEINASRSKRTRLGRKLSDFLS